MVHDEKSVGLYISPGKHGVSIVTNTGSQATHAGGCCVGNDPFLFLLACNEMLMASLNTTMPEVFGESPIRSYVER